MPESADDPNTTKFPDKFDCVVLDILADDRIEGLVVRGNQVWVSSYNNRCGNLRLFNIKPDDFVRRDKGAPSIPVLIGSTAIPKVDILPENGWNHAGGIAYHNGLIWVAVANVADSTKRPYSYIQAYNAKDLTIRDCWKTKEFLGAIAVNDNAIVAYGMGGVPVEARFCKWKTSEVLSLSKAGCPLLPDGLGLSRPITSRGLQDMKILGEWLICSGYFTHDGNIRFFPLSEFDKSGDSAPLAHPKRFRKEGGSGDSTSYMSGGMDFDGMNNFIYLLPQEGNYPRLFRFHSVHFTAPTNV